MDQVKLEEYKSVLESKKQELKQSILALGIDKNREGRGAISPDSEDQSQEVENNEVVDSLENLELKELSLVEGALKRIDSGKYGQCSECGELIAEARLKAVPHAINCINCSK